MERPIFNPLRDMGKTMQGLGVDINKIIETGVIDAGHATEVPYNEFASIDDIGSKVTDDFDMHRIANAFHELNASKGIGSSQTNGNTAPTAPPTAPQSADE